MHWEEGGEWRAEEPDSAGTNKGAACFGEPLSGVRAECPGPTQAQLCGHWVDPRCVAETGPNLPATELAVTQVQCLTRQCVDSTAFLVSKKAARTPAVARCTCIPSMQVQAGSSTSTAKRLSCRQFESIQEPDFQRRWHCKPSSLFHMLHIQGGKTPRAQAPGSLGGRIVCLSPVRACRVRDELCKSKIALLYGRILPIIADRTIL